MEINRSAVVQQSGEDGGANKQKALISVAYKEGWIWIFLGGFSKKNKKIKKVLGRRSET